jgi:hypothetical protein
MATSSSTRPGPGASRIVAIGRHPKPSTFASDASGARVTPGPKMVLKADVAGNLTN